MTTRSQGLFVAAVEEPPRDHFVRRLSVWLSVCLSHFSFAYNFDTIDYRAFIFQICVLCGKTFPTIPNDFDLTCMTLALTFDLHVHFKNSLLLITHLLWYKFDISYVKCLWLNLSNFWHCDLDRDLWPTYKKNAYCRLLFIISAHFMVELWYFTCI